MPTRPVHDLLAFVLACTPFACSDPPRDPALACDDATLCEPTITREQALAALDLVESTILAEHPLALEGLPPDLADALASARASVTAPLTTSELAMRLSQALVALGDGHTRIELPAGTHGLALPLVFTTEGPVVTDDTALLRRGDLVLEFGGLPGDDLLAELAGLVPAENPHHVRAAAPTMLARADVLDGLGLLDGDALAVVIDRSGQRLSLSLPLDEAPPAMPTPEPPSYAIDEARGVAVLRLDACVYDEAYEATLDALFDEARERDVQHVIVDLRRNEGGDATVAAALLARLGRPWTAFAVEQRASAGALAAFPELDAPEARAALEAFGVDTSAASWAIPPEAIALLLASRVPPPEDAPFTGSVHALVGPRTFSSASLLAMLVRDNGLGVLLGEPSGNAASFWGQDHALELPDTGLRLHVATARNVRAAAEGRDDASLVPDVPLALTRADAIAPEDRVLEQAIASLADE